ncbi:MAG: hypothetical protein LBC25_01060 [Holosporales bacterium]|nr:hypothetical protein [Holosporales bacterium]
MALYWACHSLCAKNSIADESEHTKPATDEFKEKASTGSKPENTVIDEIIDKLKQIKENEDQEGNGGVGNIVKKLDEVKVEVAALTKKAQPDSSGSKVTPDPYFDLIWEFRDELQDFLEEFRVLMTSEGFTAADYVSLLLPILKDTICPGTADIQADIQSQIDELLALLEGLIREYQRRKANIVVTFGTFLDGGLFSQLSVLDSGTPLTKKEYLESLNRLIELMFATESGEIRKEGDNWKTLAIKEFDGLKSSAPGQVAHSLLIVLHQQLGGILKSLQKLEKPCFRKLDALVEAVNQLIADIKSQIDSPDTSESVRDKLKVILSIIEKIRDRLVKALKQLKDSDSSAITCIEKITKKLEVFIKTKPDE